MKSPGYLCTYAPRLCALRANTHPSLTAVISRFVGCPFITACTSPIQAPLPNSLPFPSESSASSRRARWRFSARSWLLFRCVWGGGVCVELIRNTKDAPVPPLFLSPLPPVPSRSVHLCIHHSLLHCQPPLRPSLPNLDRLTALIHDFCCVSYSPAAPHS